MSRPITDAKLLRITRDFRAGILGDVPSRSMCFAVCAPLVGFLDMLGVRSELVEVDFGFINHVFLRLADGRVLDPTADQFLDRDDDCFQEVCEHGPPLPDVYLGPMPAVYAHWIDQARATSGAPT